MGELADRMEDLGILEPEDECQYFGLACQTCKRFFYCKMHDSWGD